MPERRTWHFDKSVNVPTVLAFITMVAAALGYVVQQDQRQTKVEVRVEHHEVQLKDLKVDIKGDLSRLDAKLDRLIESRNEVRETRR
jgi:CHASE1-domain containing sensor protein